MVLELGLGTYLTMGDINECTKTKSVLNALGPIAQQIVQLKLNHKGAICDAPVVMHMMKQCQMLDYACLYLRLNLNELATKRLKDDVLAEEVSQIWVSLELSLQGLTDATRDLHRGDTGVKDNNEVWNELLNFSEQFLGCLTKALLSWDHAHIRKINKILDEAIESLDAIKDVRSIEYLPASFQDFVTKVSLLFVTVEKRSKEIVDKEQRETLHILCLQLHSMLPLLTSEIPGVVVHPLSKHMKESRDMVFDRIRSIVADLKLNVGMGKNFYDLQEHGSFLTKMEQVYEITTSRINTIIESDKLPLIEDIKAPLEVVLKHSISVAQCCNQHDYSTIMAACENVLQQLKILSSLERCRFPYVPDVDITLEVLAEAIGILEHKVTMKLIRLIATTFADPFAKLEEISAEIQRLSETTNDPPDVQRGRGGGGGGAVVEEMLLEFENESDLIFQLGGLAISCCSNNLEARKIHSILGTLDWIEQNLGSAITRCSKNDHPHLRHQIYTLSRKWRYEIYKLIECIDPILHTSSFSFVIKKEVHQIWALMKSQMPTWDLPQLRTHVRKVYRLSERLLNRDLFEKFLSPSEKMKLERASSELKGYKNMMFFEVDLDDRLKQGVFRRVQHVLTVLSHISSSLNDGESLEMTEEIFGCGIYQEAAKMQGNLSGGQHHTLQTSNLLDIPIDVATTTTTTTPCTNKNSEGNKSRGFQTVADFHPRLSSSSSSSIPQQEQQKKLNNTSSPSKGGGGESKSKKNHPQLSLASIRDKTLLRLQRWNSKAGGLHHLGTGEVKEEIKNRINASTGVDKEGEGNKCDTSIDITKFLLSRSTPQRNSSSTRASKRNFNLWVKKMSVDLEDVLHITPQGKPRPGKFDYVLNSLVFDYNKDETTTTQENVTQEGKAALASLNFTDLLGKMENFTTSFAATSLNGGSSKNKKTKPCDQKDGIGAVDPLLDAQDLMTDFDREISLMFKLHQDIFGTREIQTKTTHSTPKTVSKGIDNPPNSSRSTPKPPSKRTPVDTQILPADVIRREITSKENRLTDGFTTRTNDPARKTEVSPLSATSIPLLNQIEPQQLPNANTDIALVNYFTPRRLVFSHNTSTPNELAGAPTTSTPNELAGVPTITKPIISALNANINEPHISAGDATTITPNISALNVSTITPINLSVNINTSAFTPITVMNINTSTPNHVNTNTFTPTTVFNTNTSTPNHVNTNTSTPNTVVNTNTSTPNTVVNTNTSTPKPSGSTSLPGICPTQLTHLLASSSPSSVCINTPERLNDLEVVHRRLATLKSIF